ncbi:aminoglycoside 6-adenylyltransferase [Nonomuraea sp. NPDC050404]|uniref:aminoglycoside 6-adenylyltransferase n=1 Tax=Nonomuraea sp. NPDC050404 TaxID=3155783 RepID=UPI0033F74C2F
MLPIEDRNRVHERLLTFAETDDRIVGAALTGSRTVGDADRWSDLDLVLAVRDEPADAADSWTKWLYDEFGALHHWDLSSSPRIIRVFLLPGWLELDITFGPESEFGPRGPQWRTLFGQARSLEPFPAPDRDTLIGLAWHHALHTRICIERDRRWQAEHWIGALRTHIVTLACLRLGLPTAHAKGAHLLPEELTTPLEPTLVRSLDGTELRRALGATVTVLLDELERTDPGLAARLAPMFTQLTSL